ncbi:hypothetical protein [Pontibacter roseus]|uniref:hypothetical protein n=1 Tax=Pontibacter roseus TaxID=336989 RepID=UPI00035DFE3B|nr:hypothetical protein [Pontibacter roseus]
MFSPDLPEPVLFHPLKHHLGYAKAFIEQGLHAPTAELQAALRTLGSSQMDVYIGQMTVAQIAEEVVVYLQSQSLLRPAAFRLHLNAGGADYSTLPLSDGSGWILRWGTVAGRHVHLHPARYSPHTWRIKANTPKTALAASIASRQSDIPALDVQLVNRVRVEWLGLPPVKDLGAAAGFERVLGLLA